MSLCRSHAMLVLLAWLQIIGRSDKTKAGRCQPAMLGIDIGITGERTDTHPPPLGPCNVPPNPNPSSRKQHIPHPSIQIMSLQSTKHPPLPFSRDTLIDFQLFASRAFYSGFFTVLGRRA